LGKKMHRRVICSFQHFNASTLQLSSSQHIVLTFSGSNKSVFMDAKDLQELLKLISRLEFSEFSMREGDFRLTVRGKHYNQGQQVVLSSVPAPVATAAPVAPAASPIAAASTPAASTLAAPAASAAGDDGRYVAIKSPIVGTFYRSPGPDKPVFVKVGDKVNPGMVVCIVEAMKLFNEIEADITGTVVKALVEDGSPVEYDQVLYLIDPKG
jgi:acetyl-CoA carboxylase biotin carboxyl carrier protein